MLTKEKSNKGNYNMITQLLELSTFVIAQSLVLMGYLQSPANNNNKTRCSSNFIIPKLLLHHKYLHPFYSIALGRSHYTE